MQEVHCGFVLCVYLWAWKIMKVEILFIIKFQARPARMLIDPFMEPFLHFVCH